jgi:hypothetical protein
MNYKKALHQTNHTANSGYRFLCKGLYISGLLATVLLFVQCNKDEPCETYTFPQCDLVELSNDYDPVCGCDGVTYQNAGWARCFGGLISYTSGECK